MQTCEFASKSPVFCVYLNRERALIVRLVPGLANSLYKLVILMEFDVRENAERSSEPQSNFSRTEDLDDLALLRQISLAGKDSGQLSLPGLELTNKSLHDGQKSEQSPFKRTETALDNAHFQVKAELPPAPPTEKAQQQVDRVSDKADVQKLEKKATEPTAAEAAEKKRADDYATKHQTGTTLERSLLTVSALPKDLSLSTKPGQLKLESSDFSKIVESIPGAELEPTFRKLIAGVKSATVDGGKVKIEGKVETPVQIDGPTGKMSINLKVNNPTFDVVPDDKNPKCIHLKNISGIGVEKLGIGGDIKEVTLTVEADGSGKSSLKIEIPKPVSAPPDPKDKFAFLKKAGASFMPDVSTTSIPLDAADSDKIVNRVVDKLRDWVKDPKTSPADLAATVAGVDLKTVLDGAFDGIQSIKKSNDVIEVSRANNSSHNLGGLPIEIAQTVKGKLDANGSALKISEIEGVALTPPLPAEIAKAAGLPVPFKANLKEISLSEPGKDGSRLLTVKTDSILDTLKVRVDKDLKPISDEKGQITLDIALAKKDLLVNLSVSFNPQKLDKTSPTGPDFKVTINGGDGNYVKLIEQMTGSNLEGPLKDLIKNVNSISKQGDSLQISRDASSKHDLGGIVLDAGKNIRLKITPEGANGLSISKIEGIGLRLPIQLPSIVKDLGIDPGKEVSTQLKAIQITSSDKAGQRKVLVETDHLLKKVGVILGPDMKPAQDAKGNWYMFGIVDNPISQKQLPLALRFDKNNQLAMSTQELMRIGANAAWQGTDNGGLTGAGFGIISVATEAGALALDAKDAVVDAAVKVKNVAVDLAVVAKDYAVDKAIAAKNLAVDGAILAKEGVVQGGRYIGNKARDAKNWVISLFD